MFKKLFSKKSATQTTYSLPLYTVKIDGRTVYEGISSDVACGWMSFYHTTRKCKFGRLMKDGKTISTFSK